MGKEEAEHPQRGVMGPGRGNCQNNGLNYVTRGIEQEMAAMLQDLPLSVTITKQGDLYSDEYTWQCMGVTGKASSVVDATREALQSLIKNFTAV